MPVRIRTLLLASLLVALTAQLAAAQESIDQSAKAPQTPVYWIENNPEQCEKIRRALRGPLDDHGLMFKQTPLSKVVDFLREQYAIEIQLDIPALDDLGLSTDEPIDANLRNISLGSGLKILLRQLELVYVICDEVLLITTEEQALTLEVTAIYPVGDLLQPKDSNRPGSAATVDNLIDIITINVSVDNWTDYTGPGGEAIHPIQPGLLVVTATQDVHEQIEQLLTTLRRARQDELSMPYDVEPPTPQLNGEEGSRGGGFGGGGFGGRGPTTSPRKTE